jgi:flagellar motor switch protein FliM
VTNSVTFEGILPLKSRTETKRAINPEGSHVDDKGQQRGLERLHKTLAKQMHEHYTEINGPVADVDIAFVDQTTYAEFIASLSTPSASFTFEVEAPGGGAAILDYSLPIAYGILEYPGVDKPDGQMEAKHREILGKAFKRDLASIESIWSSVVDIKGSNAQFETNPEYMKIAEGGDNVALIGFEVHFPHASGRTILCYPISLLEPVLPKLAD